MIEVILSYFGYVKVSKEILKLSLQQETYFERIYKDMENWPKQQLNFYRYVEGQRLLSKFLRRGLKNA